jgi:hypothetical protein
MNLERPDNDLMAFGRKYPKVSRLINNFYQGKINRDPGMQWPDNVLLPHGAWMVMAQGYGAKDEMEMISMARELSAVGTWKYSRDIYEFDPEVADALVSTEISDDIPLGVFRNLPSWSVYLKAEIDSEAQGVYCHLDYEYRSGALELRITQDNDRHEFFCVPIELSKNLTVAQAIMPYADPNSKSPLAQEILKAGAARGLHIDDIDLVREATALAIKPVLSLLLYLCSDEPEIESTSEPGSSPSYTRPKKVKGGYRLFAPDKTRVWEVGKSTGNAIRSASGGVKGGKKSPHIRRAHWHGYWRGKRSDEQTFGYKWLPPIAVASDRSKK